MASRTWRSCSFSWWDSGGAADVVDAAVPTAPDRVVRAGLFLVGCTTSLDHSKSSPSILDFFPGPRHNAPFICQVSPAAVVRVQRVPPPSGCGSVFRREGPGMTGKHLNWIINVSLAAFFVAVVTLVWARWRGAEASA